MDFHFQYVVIDYGHGGMIDGVYQTKGEKQYHFLSAAGDVLLSVYEGVIMRQIAARLFNKFIAAGKPAVDGVAGKKITSPVTWEDLEQRDISLRQRVINADKHYGVSFLFSLHGNAIGNSISGPSLNARGFAAFTSKGRTLSDVIAETLADMMAECAKLRVRRDTSDGDSDFEADFYVLHKTKAPAVLSENGFFVNWDDAQYLLSDEGQDAIAEAHFRAAMKYLT